MSEPSFLMSSLYVAVGGGIGSWLRYSVGRLVGQTSFPWATLTVNLVGSFVMGVLAGWLAQQDSGGETWRLLLAVGLLGGFTTFSAFSLDIASLMQRGALLTAGLYVVASVLGGIVGLLAGLALMRTPA